MNAGPVEPAAGNLSNLIFAAPPVTGTADDTSPKPSGFSTNAGICPLALSVRRHASKVVAELKVPVRLTM